MSIQIFFQSLKLDFGKRSISKHDNLNWGKIDKEARIALYRQLDIYDMTDHGQRIDRLWDAIEKLLGQPLGFLLCQERSSLNL